MPEPLLRHIQYGPLLPSLTETSSGIFRIGQVTPDPTMLKFRINKGVKTMRTPQILLCILLLAVSVPRPVAAAAQTDLYGGIGRGSPLNPGALITINQDTGAGMLVGHPDSVPG